VWEVCTSLRALLYAVGAYDHNQSRDQLLVYDPARQASRRDVAIACDSRKFARSRALDALKALFAGRYAVHVLLIICLTVYLYP
jgi:hypothetical protein